MLTIGTRGSLLATTQAGHVRDALIANGYDSQLEIVTTLGDVNMAPVDRIGVGVFTQALRDALAAGVCDIAVHSFKDLPTALDDRFQLIVPKREDPRDCLIARDGLKFAELPSGAVIGTGAPRRISQLKAMRPDIVTVPLRGNIDSRMGRVESGELDAVVLAYAGLSRVGREDEATEVFDVHSFLPAPAQGALAVECRAGEEPARAAVNSILDGKALTCATAERVVLNRLEAGCTAPVGAYADTYQNDITVTAAVVSVDGKQRLTATGTAPITEAVAVAEEIAARLLADGANKIL